MGFTSYVLMVVVDPVTRCAVGLTKRKGLVRAKLFRTHKDALEYAKQLQAKEGFDDVLIQPRQIH